MSQERPPVRVAVIGSGLAALTAAYRLIKDNDASNVQFEVHVFEKSDNVGMDSSSVTIDGTERRVDVPMRSFQGGYYPRLIELYKEIGAAFRPSNFSYSFSTWKPDTDGTGVYHCNLIYNGVRAGSKLSMPSTFRSPAKFGSGLDVLDAWVLFMLSWALFIWSALSTALNQFRLVALSSPWLRIHPSSTMTLRDWAHAVRPTGLASRFLGLEASWLSFVYETLVPLFSAVCTCSAEDALNHPAYELLEYCWLTLGTDHYVVQHGVRDVVTRLTKPIRHLHLSTCVEGLESNPNGTITVRTTTSGQLQEYGPFDHVVIGTQANQAARLLGALSTALNRDDPARGDVDALLQPLKNFHYVDTIVCNHTDSSLLPPLKDRRDLNFLHIQPNSAFKASPSDLCVLPSCVMTTHVLSNQTTDTGLLLLQTTNPSIPPRRESVLSVARLQRAVLTPAAKAALPSLATLTLRPTTWRNLWRPSESWSLGPAQGLSVRNRVKQSTQKTVGLWCCGSYAHGGIPLLEGCVVSASNVAAEIARIERERCIR
ncbi:FAD/NAD(P)-binding domain-containing protein [Auriculariales sp. MPI-PUGE-AT-0066]|nr:FAD/NAD(P)-binding domain-containing protein [Auriculariales sp. MPI-PUGE-AT-0066]